MYTYIFFKVLKQIYYTFNLGFPIGADDTLAITAFAITSLVTDLINIVSAIYLKYLMN